MADWAPKRFWKSTDSAPVDGGFGIQLDGRAVRTPAKALLVAPTRALADAIAAEWDAQDEQVNPATMPCTRSANAAIDKVTPQHAEVAAMLAAYGETDLLCYRAAEPPALVDRQAAAWDPLLARIADTFDAPLNVTQGIVPVTQPADSMARLSAVVHNTEPFALTALHDMISLTGSLVLGLAAARGWDTPQAVWALSRIDEEWQIEQWGRDEDADALADSKCADLLHAVRFWELVSA